MASIPRPQPVGTVPENGSLLREIGGDFVFFRYVPYGHPFLVCPVFWQGPETDAWLASPDGRLPEGTARFPSRAQAHEALTGRSR